MTNLINNSKLTITVYYSGILLIKRGNSCVDGNRKVEKSPNQGLLKR